MSQPSNGYPPEQLIQKWAHQASSWEDVIKEVADWQLDRCCEEVSFFTSASAATALRERCRSRPQSLKQRALIALLDRVKRGGGSDEDFDDIQEALEALPDD
jgi:hypothetical protein